MNRIFTSVTVVLSIFFLFSCGNDTKKPPIDYDFTELYDSNNDSGDLPDTAYTDDKQNDDEETDESANDENEDTVVTDDNIDETEDIDDEKDDTVNDETADVDEVSDDDVRNFKIEITVPLTSVVYEADTDITFQAKVTDTKYSLDEITVKWIFDNGTPAVLDEKKADTSGVSQFTHSFSEGEATYYTITAVAVDPDNVEVSSKDLILGICTYRYGKVQTFDTSELGTGWVMTKDSYHDSDATNGWLELTGNDINKQGAIYNSELKLSPGDITMKIDIRTGKPVPSGDGADGFAMTVYDADNTVSLTDYVNATRTGGCLGYGVAGDYCGSGGALDVNAFHIEFDTWHNNEFGLGDPTTNNHIAINLNGNPGGHQLWKEIDFEDYVWHNIEITTLGSKVTVKMDSNVIIDDTITDFSFRGGYIMFSGSTGASTNFHSVDNLEIVHECTVPED